MSTFVTVSHGARQYKIVCMPTKILNDVLIEACSKTGADVDSHGLRHGKTVIDLSLSFRFAHLPNGAKLDLIRVLADAGSKVNMALSLPEIPRKVIAVSPSHTLWQVLEQFEQEHSLAITRTTVIRDGKAYRRQTVAQLMNREYPTDEALQSVSLASLGIKSGNAVVRVSFRDTTIHVMLHSSSVIPHTSAPSSDQTAQGNHPCALPDLLAAGANIPEATQQPSNKELAPPLSRSREIEVLIPSTSTTPHFSTAPEADHAEDLKLSIEQARAYQTSLASRSQSSGAMLTQKMRDQQAFDKRSKSKPEKCRVKFRFNDGTQIISTFDPSESASELYQFVRTTLTIPTTEFSLELLGTRYKVSDTGSKLWHDLHFPAAAAIQVIGAVAVLDEYKKLGKDAKEAIAQKHDSERSATPDKVVSVGKEGQVIVPTESRDNAEPQQTLKKVPKWLQKTLGKK